MLGLVLIVAVTAALIGLIFWSRIVFLRSLAPLAEVALRRVTAGFFDGPPRTVLDGRGGARIEGSRGGELIAIEVVFRPATSQRYVQRGFKAEIGGEVSLVLGLHGANPSFTFRATPRAPAVADELADEGGRAPSEYAFARAWTSEADPDLVDDELRADLMRFVGQVRYVRSIAVTREGLRISWLGNAGVDPNPSGPEDHAARALSDTREAEQFAIAAQFAARLRKRILDALGRRAGPHVRLGAYRAGAEETAATEEVEQEKTSGRGARL